MTAIIANATSYTHRVNGGTFHLCGSFGATKGDEYTLRNTRTGVEFRVNSRTLRTDYRQTR